MKGNKPHSYERGEDGMFHILSFGRRHPNSRPVATEAEARKIVADHIEADRQCDEDDAKYSKLYHY